MEKQQAVQSLTETMAKFTAYIGKHLPTDVEKKLAELRAKETKPLAKALLLLIYLPVTQPKNDQVSLRSQFKILRSPLMQGHILLSILAYGMLTIAVFQSILLLLQDHQLKHKHPSGLIRNFPPLQTMESLLFGFLFAGWLLLSLSLLSGALYWLSLKII